MTNINTKKLTKKNAREYFDMLDLLESRFIDKVNILERKMKKVFSKDLEFFKCDGEYVGIGSLDRKVKLIHRWLE